MANIGQFMKLISKTPACIKGMDGHDHTVTLATKRASTGIRNTLPFTRWNIVSGFSFTCTGHSCLSQVCFEDLSVSHMPWEKYSEMDICMQEVCTCQGT